MKITYRNIINQKQFSFINILGLSFGMTCCIFIYLWIEDEISYDQFHSRSDKIYRVIQEYHTADQTTYRPSTPARLSPTLLEEIPEIYNATSLLLLEEGLGMVKYNNQHWKNIAVCSADPSFFQLFDFPFLVGNVSHTLSSKHSVVVTEDMAKFSIAVMNNRYIPASLFYNEMIQYTNGPTGIGWELLKKDSEDVTIFHGGSNGYPQAYLLIKPKKMTSVAILARSKDRTNFDLDVLGNQLLSTLDTIK